MPADAVIDLEELLPPKWLRVLPKRRLVKRTFSWLGQNGRLSRDYERLCTTTEAFICAAIAKLMIRRLAQS